MSREAVILGAADEFPGRYVTPWREHADILQADGTGTDHPELFPFDPMTFDPFFCLVWRVRRWAADWSVSIDVAGTGFSHTQSGTTVAVARALAVPVTVPATPAELGTHEEHRLKAGFSFGGGGTTVGIPGYPSAEESVGVFIGGPHQYILAGGGQPQKFRPAVAFSYLLDLAPGGGPEQATLGVVAERLGGGTIGTATMTLPSWNEAAMETYTSSAHTTATLSGTSILIGSADVTCEVEISVLDWWEYATPEGFRPIWNAATGAPLRSFILPPSPGLNGTPIANPGVVGGVRFTA